MSCIHIIVSCASVSILLSRLIDQVSYYVKLSTYCFPLQFSFLDTWSWALKVTILCDCTSQLHLIHHMKVNLIMITKKCAWSGISSYFIRQYIPSSNILKTSDIPTFYRNEVHMMQMLHPYWTFVCSALVIRNSLEQARKSMSHTFS